MAFKKAERKLSKIKLALTGPSGSGKTYSALLIAKGLAGPNGRIAMVDTENGSGALYADLTGIPEYDHQNLSPPFTSENYIKLIKDAVKENYDVLIIDSISHQWNGEGGIMDRLDKEKLAKAAVNSYTLWSKYTPEHEKFKQAILQSPIHIIATMRSKQDYVLEMNEKGKQAPKKVGMAPIQREGAEYEFTTVFDMTAPEHYATVSKDRTHLFDGQVFKPSEDTGVKIKDWLSSAKAEEVNNVTHLPKRPNMESFFKHASNYGWSELSILDFMSKHFKTTDYYQLTQQEYERLVEAIKATHQEGLRQS